MKRTKNIYDKICTFDNIKLAYNYAKRGKQHRRDVVIFSSNLEENLLDIQSDLMNLTYEIGKYRTFFVNDPKKRLVMALPFRDRVVQWAIYLQVNPILDRRYINTSYACRIGGGMQRAAKQLQRYMRVQQGKCFVLKMDVSKYFYRVNHDTMVDIIRRIFNDDRLCWLLEKIIRGDENFGIRLDDYNFDGERITGVGMPIGNLTSQMFANMYLNELDQFCKHKLSAKYYVRYMDDVCIVSDSKRELRNIWVLSEAFLNHKLKLKLNNKTMIRGVNQGVDFCGFRIWVDHIRLRKKTALKMKHRLKYLRKKYSEGFVELITLKCSLFSYIGQLKHCDGYMLTRSILSKICLE